MARTFRLAWTVSLASQCGQEELDQATETDPEATEAAAKEEPAAEQAASNKKSESSA